jgi:hypothetical protein
VSIPATYDRFCLNWGYGMNGAGRLQRLTLIAAMASLGFNALGAQQVAQALAAPPAVTTPAPVTVPAGAGLPVVRTLAELGFARGLTFEGMSGRRELFFAVPHADAASGMTLHLPFNSSTAYGARRSVQVFINDRPVLTQALAANASSGTLDVPVAADDVVNGFVRIALQYSGTITDNICVDQRLAGDFITFAPTGGFAMRIDPTRAGDASDVLAVMPRKVAIVLPTGAANPSQVSALLTAAAGLSSQGYKVRFTNQAPAATGGWDEGTVMLGGTAPLSVGTAGGRPAIMIGGDHPETAARLIAASNSTLAHGLASAFATQPVRRDDQRLTFDQLHGDLSVADVVGRASWEVNFSERDMPAGKTATGLRLDVAVGRDTNEAPPIVNAFVNGTLLASAPASAKGPTRLIVDLPEGLSGSSNTIRVSLIRQPKGGNCVTQPVGYPAQLLPSSEVTLSEAPHGTDDFYRLTGRFHDGVTLALPGGGDAAMLAKLLPIAASAVAGLVPQGAPINVIFDKATPKGPFIIVGRDTPEGAKPPIRFDNGRLVVADSSGNALYDAAALDRRTVAQIIDIGGTPGLWLRPASDFATSNEPMALDRGDVAFVTDRGVDLAFSTKRDRLIDIQYPDNLNVFAYLAKYRLWLIAAAWLAITAGFIWSLRRLYRRRGEQAE